MTLKEKIEAFKIANKNTFEHKFKNGTIVKHKLHQWLDIQYQDAVNEWKFKNSKNIAIWLEKLIK